MADTDTGWRDPAKWLCCSSGAAISGHESIVVTWTLRKWGAHCPNLNVILWFVHRIWLYASFIFFLWSSNIESSFPNASLAWKRENMEDTMLPKYSASSPERTRHKRQGLQNRSWCYADAMLMLCCYAFKIQLAFCVVPVRAQERNHETSWNIYAWGNHEIDILWRKQHAMQQN